jgi:hypothetical protein
LALLDGGMLRCMEPRLLERACGGWLAIAPPDSPVAVAVTADDEQAARDRLHEALEEWARLLEAASLRTDG